MIGIQSNLSALQRLWTNRRNKLAAANLSAETQTAASLHARLVKKSSGPYSTAYLQAAARRRGAGLYSVRAPAPPADPAILNLQSGSIARGWKVMVKPFADGSQTTVTNSSPHWIYMVGTSLMIARLTVEAAQKEERLPRLRRLALAKLAILKP